MSLEPRLLQLTAPYASLLLPWKPASHPATSGMTAACTLLSLSQLQGGKRPGSASTQILLHGCVQGASSWAFPAWCSLGLEELASLEAHENLSFRATPCAELLQQHPYRPRTLRLSARDLKLRRHSSLLTQEVGTSSSSAWRPRSICHHLSPGKLCNYSHIYSWGLCSPNCT